MKPEERILIRYWLSRASESLEEADLLLSKGHLHSTVSRIYYACFYAVSALLLIEGQSSSRHSGVRALFDQLWVNTGRLPKEMGRLYRRLFEKRQESDYTDFVKFDAGDVKKCFRKLSVLLTKYQKRLEKKLFESCRIDIVIYRKKIFIRR